MGLIFAKAGLESLPVGAAELFARYLALLQRWNLRLNLTAVREPGQVVQRHFCECAYAASRIPLGVETLLDFGSGAGFPGIPIAICRPEIHVTLAEGHAKKAAFLREVVRTLGMQADIFGGRVEAMAGELEFDCVALRAVEKMESAVPVAARHARKCLLLLTTEGSARELQAVVPEMNWDRLAHIPASERRVVAIGARHGTGGNV